MNTLIPCHASSSQLWKRSFVSVEIDLRQTRLTKKLQTFGTIAMIIVFQLSTRFFAASA
jgi:hypothetical protein